ncbi:hypothetical protein CLV24_11462 [Pontibacter ummariensis]|uniref:Aspartyl protease n=1 Tax=Pontibacter ummariensis TaxID=1610492 RepID=A0A239HM91_9BACT|nr:hypothetical protein [Pontibacter ummariensis]PRY10333.1 hypothetical protein CLV24_11462 [Pontibacter ummariensis]SNS82460.1 hypothetical protein SAMN06296052_11462 [Pontibacter ummariensis]
MKRTFVALGVAFVATVAACVAPGKVSEPTTDTPAWIPFTWIKGEVSGKQFDKMAMNVPLRLESIPHAFEAQFDMGATGTVILYEKNLANYFKRYPALLQQLDTTAVVYLNNTKNPVLKDISFKLGNVAFENRHAVLFKNYGEEIPLDSVRSPTAKHVGTVGAGIAKGKYLIIDYPNQRFAVQDSISPQLAAKTAFVPAKVGADNRIKVPLTINGEVHDVMFDTGASLFPLSVGTKDWYAYADTAQKDSMEITSWGQKVYMYGAPAKVDVYLGKAKLPPTKVYSLLNNTNFDNFYKQEGIVGLIGNAYFLDNVVVVDFKNKRFGVVQE